MTKRFLGQRVRGKFSKIAGIAVATMGPEVHTEHIYKVRFWNEEKNDYSEKHIHGNFLAFVHDNEEMVQIEDLGFWSTYREAAIEMALVSNDKTWFEEAMRMNGFLEYF